MAWTSYIAVVPTAAAAADLAGFLVGFVSQSRPGEAYIHFVGVRPDERDRGLGRRFHGQLGFDVEPGDREVDGLQVTTGYDGEGNDRVRFVTRLAIE